MQFQNELSSSMDFKNGTPHGSCLSPTIFSYVINCLLDQKFPASVQLVAYADDLALSCVHTNKEKLITDLQSALRYKIQDTRYFISGTRPIVTIQFTFM